MNNSPIAMGVKTRPTGITVYQIKPYINNPPIRKFPVGGDSDMHRERLIVHGDPVVT
jgi:hypothetical protein